MCLGFDADCTAYGCCTCIPATCSQRLPLIDDRHRLRLGASRRMGHKTMCCGAPGVIPGSLTSSKAVLVGYDGAVSYVSHSAPFHTHGIMHQVGEECAGPQHRMPLLSSLAKAFKAAPVWPTQSLPHTVSFNVCLASNCASAGGRHRSVCPSITSHWRLTIIQRPTRAPAASLPCNLLSRTSAAPLRKGLLVSAVRLQCGCLQC